MCIPQFNQLTHLDISNNLLLIDLDCSENQLTIINVSEHSQLRELYCNENMLTELDITNNVLLEALECGGNLFTTLDLSNNAALENDVLFSWDLDISYMPSLEMVCVWTMPFPPENFDLNMEGTPDVVFTTECGDMEAPVLYISEDSLYQQEFILATSTEDGMIYLVPENTDKDLFSIREVCIDSVTAIADAAVSIPVSMLDAGNYWLYARDEAGNLSQHQTFTIIGEIEIVDIVDINFLHTLIEQGVDTDGDSLISYDEAEAITDLNINNYWTSIRIVDLSGIEAFANLTELDVSVNSLTSLDISKNNALSVLKCYSNQLSSLDVSSNDHLTELSCFGNELSNLNISNNNVLSVLDCQINELTALDVSNNSALTELDCGRNELTSLDVAHNIHLTELWCSSNELTTLDVSNNTELRILWYGVNQLANVDISKNDKIEVLACAANQVTYLEVSSLLALRNLYCWSNQITSLDVSNNHALEYLDCSNNQLTSLNVSNNTSLEILGCGRNQITFLDLSNNISLENSSLLSYYDLDISFMPSLTKVCVWTMPFPPDDFVLVMEGSPNVYFTADCEDLEAPVIYMTEDSLYQPEIIRAISTEDGMIYLVPENTSRSLVEIREACLDSVPAVADEIVDLSTADLGNGNYWIYARDNANNISDPKEFTINGVGVGKINHDDVRIYPNPADEIITVQINGAGKYIIEVVSLKGRYLYTQEVYESIHQIDLSPFRKGIYFITVRSQDFVTTRKIIKLSDSK